MLLKTKNNIVIGLEAFQFLCNLCLSERQSLRLLFDALGFDRFCHCQEWLENRAGHTSDLSQPFGCQHCTRLQIFLGLGKRAELRLQPVDSIA